jgi:hypothetical protein
MMSGFPEVVGTNLNGQKFRLPGDFEGDLNLVFVAFQREQQLMVNTWLPTADVLESLHPRLKFYELPSISRMNPVARWFINTGMRSGIKDPNSRHKTITLFLDKEPFRKALDIPGEENIHIFLVNRQGQVAWRSEGPCDADKAKRLSDFVASFFKS